MVSGTTAFSLGTQKAAYIELSGTISSSGPSSAFSSTGITPGQVRNLNDRVKNQGYRAVIYEINSGGGTVVASKEIMREIESMDIPTVCRFRDVAASGAYLFSLGCDEIVADKASMTGSIGVRSSYLEFSEALEKYGVEYVNITAGEFKGVGSPYMNSTEEDREILSEQASEVHQQFLNLVKEERNLTQEQINEVGEGQVILGKDAKTKGLVDHLGGRSTAETVAENITEQELSFESVQTTQSFNLFSLLSMDAVNSIISAISGPESPLTARLG
ncbi:signal peptide peptidase SppA [Candidatus Nanosalina sp. VS9-1]|uniref:signal peptide peptidase SppA n=1 Tax=Candidatus Nanosalina sp. VS9-1 TaxID=3388566 RepID=UPI0039E068AE